MLITRLSPGARQALLMILCWLAATCPAPALAMDGASATGLKFGQTPPPVTEPEPAPAPSMQPEGPAAPGSDDSFMEYRISVPDEDLDRDLPGRAEPPKTD